MRAFKYILSALILMTMVSCESTNSKSLDTPRIYKDLCEFDGAIVVKMKSSSENVKYLECLQNGIARSERIHPTLYRYLDNYIEPGNKILCDSTVTKKIEHKYLIPPLEKITNEK